MQSALALAVVTAAVFYLGVRAWRSATAARRDRADPGCGSGCGCGEARVERPISRRKLS